MRWLVAAVSSLLFAIATAASIAATPLPATDIKISFSGDVLTHNSLYLRARTDSGYNFYKQLRRVRPYLQNSIDICHLETPLTRGTPASYPRFATPYQLAKALRQIGFEGCSVVSNHTLDRGVTGISETYAEMRAVGLVTSGTRPSPAITSVGWYRAKAGIEVANLAYTYSFNGLDLQSDETWRANLIDLEQIKQDASAARAAGADVVVISLHWGNEYESAVTTTQREIAEALTASTAIDAVVGHHAHVLQAAEIINNKPVLFGLGNLWAGQGPWADMPQGQFGLIATLQFRITNSETTFISGSQLPTFTRYGSWELAPASKYLGVESLACAAITNANNLTAAALEPSSDCE
ncbi:MAG: hypothetical protein RL038_678 [Actinomycetota bacterium]|jgi:poly-gamma-glutamate synthesis protein (capsule biosynthesis protein)